MRKYDMKAYIDNYDEITYLVTRKTRYKVRNFYLYDAEDLVEKLTILYQTMVGEWLKIGLKVKTKLNLHHSYVILDDYNHVAPVFSGSVVRTAEFESEFYYSGRLGFDYSKESTLFRVWSPVAKSIFIELKFKDGKVDKREMSYGKKGVWFIEVFGDLDGIGYIYYVKVFDKYERVNDPYGIASDANGRYNYVIDIDNLYKPKHAKPFFSGFYTDAIIYEASIRDLTCQLDNDKKGTYLGLVDENSDKGLNYIASLGITHLQLMPVFDFGGIDDLNKDAKYNWGYNPEQYFVPCGWYSKNPEDPYSRINEYLELVDEAHKRGLRVVMDVVYNHVHEKDKFPFEHFVPGYFYRVDQYGNYTNTSGCGNDLATEKRMCSKFIIDNLKFWAKYYQISGFRFDLMGLLDIETLNLAYEELKQIDSNIMVYGEGWNMPNTIPDAYRPHSYNHFKMPKFAFFNDKFRDLIKGNQWDKSAGFAFGNDSTNIDVMNLLAGSCYNNYRFQNPNQTVNYVECHDNYTFYDFGRYALEKKEEEVIRSARLALHMVVISLGIVFFRAGEEFYGTKRGVENSYNAKDEINLFDYHRKELYQEDIQSLKELIAIRKAYHLFRLTNAFDIEQKIHYNENISDNHLLCYSLEDSNYRLTLIIKNDLEAKHVIIPNSELLFDGHHKVSIFESKYDLLDMGVYIFKEKK